MKQLFFKRPSSVRSRVVAATAAAALALVSVGVATGVATAAVTPSANPDLAAGCGADLTLILDDSNSLWNNASFKQAVADAGQAFADGFRDTNSTLAVVRFNTTASTMSVRVPLTGSAFSDLDDDFLNGTRPPGGANGVGQGGTNWEAALQTANTHVVAGGTRPQIVVMITDGQPTVSSDSGNGAVFSQGALDDGITQANLIKAKGAHILTVGVGSAFDTDQFKAALTDLSGKDVFPAGSWPDGQGYNRQANFVASGANTTDAVLVTDFSSLATSIALLTAASCKGSLTITKEVVDAAGQTTTSGPTVDGWQFSATRPNSGYDWITPAAGGAETRSSTTGASGNLNGVAAFQWGITGANGNVGVAETVNSGYTMTDVSCEGGATSSVNLGAGTFNVAVAQNASVSCVVTNTETPIVDIELDKTILGSSPYLVDTVRTFKLSVTNKGPVAATGVEVKDTLPSDFTSPSITAGSNAVIAGNIVTWSVGNLAVDETKTLEISGTLSEVGPMTNWTQVNKTTQQDVDSTPNNCSLSGGALVTPEDDCDKVDINVTREYTLDIDKKRVGSTGPVTVGDQVQYDVVVKNLGPSTATSGLVVTDTLPGGLTNVSFAGQGTGAADWSCPGSPIASTNFGPAFTTFTCTYNETLAKDVERTIRVTATIGAALADVASIENLACVKKAPGVANDDCDDEDIDLTPTFDLVIDKEQIEGNPVPIGSEVTYTLKVTNQGPSKATTGFVVTDPVPFPLEASSASGTDWDCDVDENDVTCTFEGDDLPVGAAPDIIVEATVSNEAANHEGVINEACVAYEDKSDCDSVETEFPQGDLTLVKSNDPTIDEPLVGFGGEITYTLAASADGTLDQTNVVITDTLPGYGPLNSLKTELVDGSVACIDSPVTRIVIDCNGLASGDGITVSGNDLSWSVGTVTAGSTKYVTFTVTVPLPNIEDIEPGDLDSLTRFVRNIGFVTSDFFEDDVPSNEVENKVVLNRLTAEPFNTCVTDTPLFSIGGEGFYAGETVKLRVYKSDQTTVVSDEFATATAAADGTVSFSNLQWPGFAVDGITGVKTYPGLDLRPIYVQLYGSPATALQAIGYPGVQGTCDGQLSIDKTNTPSADTTITEFGAEIDYSITVSYPEGSAYNAEDVVISDILPGYDAAAHPESGTVTYVADSLECADFDDLGGLATCDGGHAGGAFYDDATKAIKVNLGQMRPGDSRTVTFTVTVDEQGTEVDGVIEFDVDNRATVTSEFTTPAFDDVTNPVAVEPIVDEPQEPAVPEEPADDTEVLGTKLPATGAAIGSIALLGIVLVGSGAILSGTVRRRNEDGTLA